LKLQRTIHAKLVLDRKGKRDAIAHEYWAWQRQLQGLGEEELYSATKQQADRFRRRIKKQNHRGPNKSLEYPMILRRDCIKVEQKPDSVFKWWLRLPLRAGSVWVPIQFPDSQERLLKLELHESKLIRSGDNWYVDIAVQKQARLKRRYVAVLPIDMGIRKLATTIEDGKPNFYGKDVRRTRGGILQAPTLDRQGENREEVEA
jgi:putative transposase